MQGLDAYHNKFEIHPLLELYMDDLVAKFEMIAPRFLAMQE